MSLYELAVLGDVGSDQRSRLTETIDQMVGEFGLTQGVDVVVRDGTSFSSRDPRAAAAVAYFGGSALSNADLIADAVAASLPVIPVIASTGEFSRDIPEALHGANGLRLRPDDVKLQEVGSALLECVGLLRRQRRVFVSYRRTEARAAAVQLHDDLSARGFDVFLDTHGVRPGDPFQEVLWHRLCDSDVLVMLDTPSYFESRWTRYEIGRARAKEIHVLRVAWPGHRPSKLTDIAETIYLSAEDLVGDDGPIARPKADRVALSVEWLRSRSIASRYMSITGKLRADVERIGARVEGVGAHRAISVRLLDDTLLWAYPVVGFPSAELLHDVAMKAERSVEDGTPVLVYDHVGIGEVWSSHVKWLNEQVRAVRCVKVAEAGWTLAAWGQPE